MMDVLDGKELVLPLNLSESQARSLTTCQASGCVIINGSRNLFGLVLPVQAFVFRFPYSNLILGMN